MPMTMTIASPPPAAAPDPSPDAVPAPVPDHAFEESVAGEEDPGAGIDNEDNRVPPPTRDH